MKIIAIRENTTGKNEFFISDNYDEFDLNAILNLAEKGALENISIVHSKTKEKHIRTQKYTASQAHLEPVAMTCNINDYLLFNGKYLILKTINGKIKKQWPAVSGFPGTTQSDQNQADKGPLPEGIYTAHFDQTLDFQQHQGLWDAIKWLIKSPAWGWIATPLTPSPKTNTFGRGNFYIHGGNSPGSKGCIDLTDQNENFHVIVRLYKRNLKLVVKY